MRHLIVLLLALAVFVFALIRLASEPSSRRTVSRPQKPIAQPQRATVSPTLPPSASERPLTETRKRDLGRLAEAIQKSDAPPTAPAEALTPEEMTYLAGTLIGPDIQLPGEEDGREQNR